METENTTKTTAEVEATTPVWIFGLTKKMSSIQLETIRQHLTTFTQNWKSHQKPMPGQFEIKYQQFIVLINRYALSGCSIDSAFTCIKEVERLIELSTTPSPKLFYRNEKNEVTFCERYQASSLIKKGIITENTIIFNPTVNSWKDYQVAWEIPAKNSWLFSSSS